MSQSQKALTPMLKQYLDIKKRYPDCILFYRMGDFYEMFYDDAIVASKILDITLTSRDKNKENPIPMCGVPHHAADGYITKLVREGKKVAICEQVEDPKKAKGIVKRKVIRVVTPGLLTLEGGLDSRENNFIAAVLRSNKGKALGISFMDLSTGEFRVTRARDEEVALGELFRIQPRELILSQEERGGPLFTRLSQALPNCFIGFRSPQYFELKRAKDALKEHFRVVSLDGFGLANKDLEVQVSGALLSYGLETQQGNIDHISNLSPYELERFLKIDESSVRNLELISNSLDGSKKGSLLSIIDKTVTSMGARMLKKWLLYPLIDRGEIEKRLRAVKCLFKGEEERVRLRKLLKGIYDLERLIGRVVMQTANARDLLALKESLGFLPEIRSTISSLLVGNDKKIIGLFRECLDLIDPMEDLFSLIDRVIREDSPVTLRDGNLIKTGFNKELDEIIEIQRNGRKFISRIEAKERERTGISNLKIGYNRVFGYYLEVSKAQSSKVPDDYIRKQTLVSSERYVTPELKEIEEKILSAQEKRLSLEYEIFCEIRDEIGKNAKRIQDTARALAVIDCIQSLSEVALQNDYVCPEIIDGDEIDIRAGRHPVVEKNLEDKRFVPNDIRLNHKDSQLILITGPNMAGKSTVLRQTALICLLAQMGSFVPAKKAKVSILDQIFTRVGATDYLSRGQSTFMVEMKETANILNNATSKSLVILDEIGRGTSTYDGLSIAWAVSEHLLFKDKKGVKTLFATHYHELTSLSKVHKKVKNMHVEVKEYEDNIYFLHTLKEGATSKSYGIQVAALAGVPQEVIENAKRILREIENKNSEKGSGVPIASINTTDYKIVVQKTLPLEVKEDDRVKKRLLKLDINQITPLEAINILNELCELVRKRN